MSKKKQVQLLLKLAKQGDRQMCIKTASKLTDTNTNINEDVSKTSRDIRKSELPTSF